MPGERTEIYEFGGFRLDVGEHKLKRLNGPTNGSIPEKAFQTLVHLVRNHGTLLTKDELLETVWRGVVVEENNLVKAIYAIRRFLDDIGEKSKYIETIPKHGYRFVADVIRIENGDCSGVGTFPPGPAAKGRVKVAPDDRSQTSLPDPTNPAAAPDQLVQPPAQRGGDQRPQVDRRVGPEKDANAISFDRSSANSETKHRRTQIGTALAFAALIGLGGWFLLSSWRPAETGSPPQNSGSDTVRSPAYDLYVRGKVKVASENLEDTEAAIGVLEEAIRIDPNFAEAYAQLARGYNTIAFKYSSDADRKRYHENAEVAIEKALALNPNLAEAHFARGLILWSNTRAFPHEKVIASYKRSLALAPNLDETHHQLSLVYSHIGLLDEAEASVNKALEINPNNTLARYRAGVYAAYKGKFGQAISVFKTIPRDFTPMLVDRSMAEALIQSGRHKEAEAITEDYLARYPKDEGGSFTSLRALLLAKAGKGNEAEVEIARAAEIGRGFGHFHHTAYNIASAYAALNRPDDAVRWLEDAADTGFPNYKYFEVDPNLDNIRQHPGFVEFMTRLKDRWKEFKALA